MTAAAINVRLTDLFVELSQARRALETCPASERLSIANRIKVVMDEIDRGQSLLRANQSPPTTTGESDRPVRSNPDGRGAAFLPLIQKVTT